MFEDEALREAGNDAHYRKRSGLSRSGVTKVAKDDGGALSSAPSPWHGAAIEYPRPAAARGACCTSSRDQQRMRYSSTQSF